MFFLSFAESLLRLTILSLGGYLTMSAAICQYPAAETHLLDEMKINKMHVLQTVKQTTCDYSTYLKLALKIFTQNPQGNNWILSACVCTHWCLCKL